MSDTSGTSTYAFSRAYGLRLVGLALLPFGVLWVVAGLTGFPGWAVWTLVALGVVAAAAVLRLLVLPPRLLTLSAEGYQIHHVRGNPTAAAAWSQVEEASTQQLAGSPAVVIALTGGQRSLLPVPLLGLRAVEAQREIHDRLNTAFGYRRLEGA
ncbi:MAG: hypothetical protein ACRDQA_17985 [Nocardioidaceae bacterium]